MAAAGAHHLVPDLHAYQASLPTCAPVGCVPDTWRGLPLLGLLVPPVLLLVGLLSLLIALSRARWTQVVVGPVLVVGDRVVPDVPALRSALAELRGRDFLGPEREVLQAATDGAPQSDVHTLTVHPSRVAWLPLVLLGCLLLLASGLAHLDPTPSLPRGWAEIHDPDTLYARRAGDETPLHTVGDWLRVRPDLPAGVGLPERVPYAHVRGVREVEWPAFLEARSVLVYGGYLPARSRSSWLLGAGVLLALLGLVRARPVRVRQEAAQHLQSDVWVFEHPDEGRREWRLAAAGVPGSLVLWPLGVPAVLTGLVAAIALTTVLLGVGHRRRARRVELTAHHVRIDGVSYGLDDTSDSVVLDALARLEALGLVGEWREVRARVTAALEQRKALPDRPDARQALQSLR
ncbi:MAG: hypothetical protein KC656_04125 [Myxococcales bacterium]|nr:hypothetical protein [Myxococcales bacterium]